MSTVIRPRGPLPRRVYWARRLWLAVVLVVLAAFVWWVLPGGSSPRAAGSASQGQQQHTGAGSTSGGSGVGAAGVHPTAGMVAGPSPSGVTTPPATSKPPTTPTTPHPSTSSTTSTTGSGSTGTSQQSGGSTLTATTTCTPSSVRLAVQTHPITAGATATIALEMASGTDTACNLALSPRMLVAQITTGTVTVWRSSACPDALPARNVVVGPTMRQVYTFRWDGHDFDTGCASLGKLATAGAYWVEAALVGGNPAKAYLGLS